MKLDEKKLTDWFPPWMKPVRRGVYQVRHTVKGIVSEGFAYWDGFMWQILRNTIKEADGPHNYISSQQNKSWRGLKGKSK